MAQDFITYEQQLNKLQNDKSLSIPNLNEAKRTLEEISYYSLITGYKNLFLHSASKKYKFAYNHYDYYTNSIFSFF